MNNKMLLLLMLIFMFSISAVSAYDNATCDVGVDDAESIAQADSIELGDYQGAGESGSFTELNDEISGIAPGGNFTLKKDYKYVSGDSNYIGGIKITADNVVIDGAGCTIDGAGQARIFHIVANNVTLKNINFINGHSNESGGAILVVNSLNIWNSTFDNNTAVGSGGAVYIENAFSDCNINSTFINNEASMGGAICFMNTTNNITITGYFEANKAERTGGAIYFREKSWDNTIAADFYNNSVKEASGGAIFFYNLSQNNLFECNFTYNYALYGGGIFFRGKANNNKFNSDFRFNVAESCGGGMFFYSTTDGNNFTGYYANNSALGNVDPTNGNGGAITFKGISSNSIFTCDFVNNTAVLNGGGVNFRQTPYNVTFNSNFINNNAENGGGVNFFESFENVVFNGIFISNHAFYGGAIALKNGSIENTSFWNNSAESGGAIYFDDNGTVSGCEFNNNILSEGYGDGGAVYFRNDGAIDNCNFTNNEAVFYGGAVYFGQNGTVNFSNFNGNEAQSGGSVYIFSTGEVNDCNFTNNRARTGGAIDFWKKGSITNSRFNDNFARFSGGAVYCSGDVKIDHCIFNNNSVNEYAGGAIFLPQKGDITHSNFTNNSADSGGAIFWRGNDGKMSESIFFNNSADDKGGAIFLEGSNVNFYLVNFTGNNAVKGSAIYKTNDADDFNISDVVFGRNRANSNKIIIEVEGNESYAPNNNVTVYVYLLANDNIANSIWNNGGIETIKLKNVFCEFSSDGNGRNLFKFNADSLQNPTDGFVDSSSIWQSPHDRPVVDAQLLDILITSADGDVIYNLTDGIVNFQTSIREGPLSASDDSGIKVTDVDGKIKVGFQNLESGVYNIVAEHAGDEYYTYMGQNDNFVVHGVVLNVTKTADSDVVYNGDLINFTIVVSNAGSGNATNVILTDLLPDSLIYSNWGIINANGAITDKILSNGIELNISNVDSGKSVSLWIEALTNGVGKSTNNVTAYCNENQTKVNGSATVKSVIRTKVSVGNVTSYPDRDVTIPIRVTADDNKPINGNVIITFPDGTNQKVKIVNGVGNAVWHVPADYKPNRYNDLVRFPGDDTYSPSNGVGTINVVKIPVDIIVGDVTAKPGDKVTIPIIVIPRDGSVFNGKIDVELPDGTRKVVDIIDGVGSIDWMIPLDYDGDYLVKASFGGNNLYYPSNGSGSIKVISDGVPAENAENHDSIKQIDIGHDKTTGNPILALLLVLSVIIRQGIVFFNSKRD